MSRPVPADVVGQVVAAVTARDGSLAGAEELWRKWMAEEERFFAGDGTRDRADLIVDTTGRAAR